MNTRPKCPGILFALLAALAVVGCAQPGASAGQPTATPPLSLPGGSPVAQVNPATPEPVETAPPTATVTPTPPPTATRTPIPCTDTHGEVILDSFESEIAGGEVRFRVYLPPCYGATARRYPVLYMMHGLGWNMDDAQWDRMGIDEAADDGYAQGALPPMIIVMPNGNDADYSDSQGASPVPDMMVHELIPLVDSRYCTWAEPQARAIGGLSRGGFWAYWIAFNHPDMFSRVGGHSPYFYQPFYPTDKNPFNVVDTAEGIERLVMYMDHGGMGRDAIEVQPGVRSFIEHLKQRGIEPEYVVNPYGDHLEEYWAEHVAEYLTFYGADWPRNVEEYPSCHAGG